MNGPSGHRQELRAVWVHPGPDKLLQLLQLELQRAAGECDQAFHQILLTDGTVYVQQDAKFRRQLDGIWTIQHCKPTRAGGI